MKTLFGRLLRHTLLVAAAVPIALPSPATAQAFNPPNEGEPVQTVGGASRGTCATGSISDVKFFMKQDDLAVSFLEAALPAGMAKQVFFSLRSADDQTLYQGFLPVDTETNSVQIPYHTLAQLADGTTYNWSVAVICGKSLRPDSPVFQGTL